MIHTVESIFVGNPNNKKQYGLKAGPAQVCFMKQHGNHGGIDANPYTQVFMQCKLPGPYLL
jgi:hypothetical protein